ncbi:hypothetical protein P153DRAFT_391303 [Dothidotthia symphoricarpi CBS 119687]|uniref:J domain-containing protein n=1 Tax=Dothidotthia symphoricarpi CBS 119687 TaxID=1392245 RepID=A0A6A5ZZF3_9PLEO|nr:uncharacterized protein P153DRAFT_391303 [Dothidotthia symphoricarpi CBS 119687]KAF2123701.1 hypothetical protein P153DRAFT_391303 [Dothidotthia symphoricarpi CBS 119687]
MSPKPPDSRGRRRARRGHPPSGTIVASREILPVQPVRSPRVHRVSAVSSIERHLVKDAASDRAQETLISQAHQPEMNEASILDEGMRMILQHPTHKLTNSERFFIEYVARPQPSRTRSEPPSPRRKVPEARVESGYMPRLRRGVDKAKRYGRRGIAKLKRRFESTKQIGAAFLDSVWEHKRAVALTIVALAVMGSLIVMHRNGRAYINQPPPAIITSFRAYPSWMHISNAYQVLDIPEPLDVAWVPRMSEVDAAYREANKRVHPDKWRVNGFNDQASAECAQRIIGDAHLLFEQYWKSPYCALARRGNDSGLLQPMATLEHMASCGLPSFSNTCSNQCTFSAMALDGLNALVTSPEYQKRAPEDAAELSAYCPCSLTKKIRDLMKNLEKDRIPPPGIRRYWGDTLSKQVDWKAWGYFQYPSFFPRIKPLMRWWDRRDLHPYIWSAAKVNRLKAQGWIVQDDIAMVPTGCWREKERS